MGKGSGWGTRGGAGGKRGRVPNEKHKSQSHTLSSHISMEVF